MGTEYPFLLGLAMGPQAARGVADPTIAGLTGALAESDGLILGDPNSGIGGTGITLNLARNFSDKGVIPGSFTRSFADRIGTLIDTFSVAITLKGNGSAAPALDADFALAQGPNALHEAAGLAGQAWGGGVGWEYVPAATQIQTAKLWLGNWDTPDNSIAVVLKDIEAALSLQFTPGEIAIATFTCGGAFESYAEEATPTFDYGGQFSLSAPAVQNVAHSWGFSATPRGYRTMTIGFDNQTEDVPDSNVEGGSTQRQTGRDVTIDAQIVAEDQAPRTFEFDQLEETDIANAEPLTFTAGGVGADPAEAYRILAPSPELIGLAPNQGGNSQDWDATLRARATTSGGEFSLIYL